MYDEPEWELPFLAALAECGIIKHAAKAAKVGKTTADRRRKDNPEFARRVAAVLPPKEERQKLIDRTKRPGPDSPSPQWRAIFLQALAETSNVSASAALAKVDTARAYRARREEPAFAGKWRIALREGYDNLEFELLGYLRAPQAERKMDVAAAVRLLAAHRVTVERERVLDQEEDVEAVRASIDKFIDAIRVNRAARRTPLIEAKPDDEE